MAWCPGTDHDDVFVVGYGSFDYAKQGKGYLVYFRYVKVLLRQFNRYSLQYEEPQLPRRHCSKSIRHHVPFRQSKEGQSGSVWSLRWLSCSFRLQRKERQPSDPDSFSQTTRRACLGSQMDVSGRERQRTILLHFDGRQASLLDSGEFVFEFLDLNKLQGQKRARWHVYAWV